jgi:ABC-type phosphate/phosphonate transport system, periplasmic component
MAAWGTLIGAIALGLMGCASGAGRGEPYIDFRNVESLPVASAVTTDAQALRVAISSILLPQETVVHYRTIANYLGEQLGRPVILIQRKSYTEIALLLLNGGADIAFFSSGAYGNYIGFDEIEMLASQQRMGVPYYQGYLLVAKDSGINELADLRGKTVAFIDPLSYSGYTFLVQQLWKHNETPEKYFGRYIYTYSHEKSFRAVANRVVDAAPVTSIIYDRAKIKTPDLAEEVKVIAISPQAGIGPVVAGKSVGAEQRAVLRRTLLTMHENPAMRAALQGLMIDKWVMPQPELFEPIRRMVSEKRQRS